MNFQLLISARHIRNFILIYERDLLNVFWNQGCKMFYLLSNMYMVNETKIEVVLSVFPSPTQWSSNLSFFSPCSCHSVWWQPGHNSMWVLGCSWAARWVTCSEISQPAAVHGVSQGLALLHLWRAHTWNTWRISTPHNILSLTNMKQTLCIVAIYSSSMWSERSV